MARNTGNVVLNESKSIYFDGRSHADVFLQELIVNIVLFAGDPNVDIKKTKQNKDLVLIPAAILA